MQGDAAAAGRGWHPRMMVLLIMGGFGVMGGGLLAPALPSLVEPFSVSETSVGLVLGVYTFAAAISLPVTGLLIDFFGRRTVGIGCLITDGAFGLLCLAAPNFEVLLLLRFVQGIGIAGLIPVAMTVIADWYSGEARLQMMGLLSGTISFSAVVIPLVGGVLAGASWRYPFMVYGLSLILALLYFFFVPESRPKRQREDLISETKAHASNLLRALRLRAVQVTFAHCLVIYFSLYTVVTFFPLVLSSAFGLHGPAAGVALSLQGVIASLIAWQAVKIKRILSQRNRLLGGFFLIFAAFVSMALCSGLTWLGISLVVFGAGMGILQPTVYNQATTVAPEELTGSIVSLFNTVKFAGMTLAPVLLGIAHPHWSLSGVFWAAGAASFIWMLASLTTLTTNRSCED